MEIFVQLVQAISWPIVALICLPFIISRADALVKAISDVKDLSGTLPDVTRSFLSISGTSQDLARIKQDLIEIKEMQAIRDREEAAESEAKEEILAESAAIAGATPANSTGAPDPFVELRRIWLEVVNAMEAAYRRGDVPDLDKRSLGQAARKLADQRRRFPIAFDDAEKIAELHGTYKGYIRLRNQETSPLTAERLHEFHEAAMAAVQILNSFGVPPKRP